MSIRILLVGSDETWSIERLYAKYMSAAGASIKLFSAQNLFYDYYQQSILNKIRFRLGLSKIYDQINQQLMQQVADFQPQVIWVFKGMEILPATLRQLKRSGIKIANYNPDNPFIFTGSGSGNKNVTDSIGLYDMHFTYSKEIEQQLKKTSEAKTHYLPFGYDLDDSVFADAKQQAEVVKCCFLGNPDRTRAKFIKELAESDLEIDLYGHFWKSYINRRNVTIHAPVYGIAFYKTLQRYRVQLNIMRVHNLRSHNMRTFEIPAIGGIQLAPDTPEHRLFFLNEKEIFLYNNARDCSEKIKKLLAMPADEAREVRLKARERSVQSGYSYRHRSQQALEALKELVHA